jgi:hypothetical protein
LSVTTPMMRTRSVLSSFVEVDGRPHSHGHRENVYAARKLAFPSSPPCRTFLQAFVKSLNVICGPKHDFMFALCSLAAEVFRRDEPTFRRYKQTVDTSCLQWLRW